MLEKIKSFTSQLVCDPASGKASLGRVAFWVVLAASIYNYKSFDTEWAGLVAAILAYCYGSKKISTPDTGGDKE